MARPDSQDQYGGTADPPAAVVLGNCELLLKREGKVSLALKRAGEDEMYDAELLHLGISLGR